MGRSGRASNRSEADHRPPTPTGFLTGEEIEQIGQAYVDGARGSLLIGLRDQRRLLTTLLPPSPTESETALQIMLAARQFSSMGCDGCLYVRQAHLRAGKEGEHQSLLLLEAFLKRGYEREVYLLSPPSAQEQLFRLSKHPINEAAKDACSQKLSQVFSCSQPPGTQQSI